MKDRRNNPTVEGNIVMEMHTELPEEIVGWITDAASRFNVTRSEIIQRAVEHYLGHVEEVRVAFEQREQHHDPVVDWHQAKQTMQGVHCPYEDCPFSGDCPVEICPL
jgi:predicted DNA-binding protein